MKWFLSMGCIPLFGYIYGIVILRKRNENVKNVLKIDRDITKLLVINLLIIFIALALTISGIYKNYTYSQYCINEGVLVEGEIIDSTMTGPYEIGKGYYYNILIKDAEKMKVRAYAQSYFREHEIVNVFLVIDDKTKSITASLIDGENECVNGNDDLEMSIIIWLISCMIWLKRHEIY